MCEKVCACFYLDDKLSKAKTIDLKGEREQNALKSLDYRLYICVSINMKNYILWVNKETKINKFKYSGLHWCLFN